jgi:hypothetical protein
VQTLVRICVSTAHTKVKIVAYLNTPRCGRIGTANFLLQSCYNLFLVYSFRSYNDYAVSYFFLMVGIPDDSSNYVLHISNRIPLNAVRWNPGNQDEVCSIFILYEVRHYSLFLFLIKIGIFMSSFGFYIFYC